MKRLLPFIVLIVLFVGFLVSVPFLLQPDGKREPLARYLSERLKHPVQIGKLDASFLPPTLRLHGVTVMQNANTVLFQAEGIEAPLEWASLFRGHFVPRALIFNQWTLSIHRRPNGSWDWDAWWTPASQWSASERWPLRTLALRGGTIRWIDPFAPVSQELTLQSVEGALDRDRPSFTASGMLGGVALPSRVAFQAQGRFFSTPQWTGELRLGDNGRQWILRIDQKEGKTDVTGESAEWRFDHAWALVKFFVRRPARTLAVSDPPLLQDWKTRFASQGSRIAFSQDGRLAGGQAEWQGEVIQNPGAAQARFQGAVKDFELAALAPVLGETLGWEGKLTAVLTDFEAPLSSQPWSGVRGKGVVELREGRYRFPVTTLQRLAKSRTMGALKKKHLDLATKGLPFRKLRGRATIHNGLITVEEAVLQADALQASGVGRVDGAREGLDAYAQVRFQGRTPYGRLQGTWNDWTLRALPSSKIPAGTQTKLRKSLTQK